MHRRRRRSSAPLSPASGWCPHLIATLCIVVGAGHQRHSPPQAGGAPTSSLRSASSSAQVISATLPRKRVVPPPHRYALHRRRRRSSAPLSPASGWCPHLIATLCIVVGAGHRLSSSSRCDLFDRSSGSRACSGRSSS
ncbi:hypothetical protein FDK63_04980 [Mycobacterium tuberculosis]|nr:hypothetical protein FDK63_04980 [Mycobacterium tuberculosis]